MELYVFDILKQSISIHQPLARVLAGELIIMARDTRLHCLFEGDGSAIATVPVRSIT